MMQLLKRPCKCVPIEMHGCAHCLICSRCLDTEIVTRHGFACQFCLPLIEQVCSHLWRRERLCGGDSLRPRFLPRSWRA